MPKMRVLREPIHEHLPPQAKPELKEVGWTKRLGLAKRARRDGDFSGRLN
jgi:hypothetical protein